MTFVARGILFLASKVLTGLHNANTGLQNENTGLHSANTGVHSAKHAEVVQNVCGGQYTKSKCALNKCSSVFLIKMNIMRLKYWVPAQGN